MFESNSVKLEFKARREELLGMVKLFRKGVKTGIFLFLDSDENSEMKEKRKKFVELYDFKYDEFIKELEKMQISNEYEIIYGNDKYTSSDSMISIIRRHMEIIETLITTVFGASDELLEAQKRYEDFWKKFIELRKMK